MRTLKDNSQPTVPSANPYYFFIIIIVGHETTAAARWALLLIVRAFSMTPSPLQSGQVFMGPSVTEDDCAVAGHSSDPGGGGGGRGGGGLGTPPTFSKERFHMVLILMPAPLWRDVYERAV